MYQITAPIKTLQKKHFERLVPPNIKDLNLSNVMEIRKVTELFKNKIFDTLTCSEGRIYNFIKSKSFILIIKDTRFFEWNFPNGAHDTLTICNEYRYSSQFSSVHFSKICRACTIFINIIIDGFKFELNDNIIIGDISNLKTITFKNCFVDAVSFTKFIYYFKGITISLLSCTIPKNSEVFIKELNLLHSNIQVDDKTIIIE